MLISIISYKLFFLLNFLSTYSFTRTYSSMDNVYR